MFSNMFAHVSLALTIVMILMKIISWFLIDWKANLSIQIKNMVVNEKVNASTNENFYRVIILVIHFVS